MPCKASTARIAVKTVSWRAFAAVDSFVVFAASSIYFGSGDLKMAATAALSAVGLEAITKVGWFFLHEKVWESETMREWFK